MLSAIWAEIMTPSTFAGPLEKAYRRAVIGIALRTAWDKA